MTNCTVSRVLTLLFGLFLALSVHAKPGDLQKIHVKDGTLYFDDGSEVALWGVNFQTAMSYELNRFRKYGHFRKFDLAEWKKMTDRSFDEIQLLGCDVIRIHLSPS